MSLSINSDFNGVTDPDAGRYIAAVEAADGQLLEFAVGRAMNNFIVGCKTDGTWDAIKASCILSGARTLAGALVPLAGTAPTNVGPFVTGDYNRKTGLLGASGKYLNSNVLNNSLPATRLHVSAYTSSVAANAYAIPFGSQTDGALMFGTNWDGNPSTVKVSCNSNMLTFSVAALSPGFLGVSQPQALSRWNGVNRAINPPTLTPPALNILLFGPISYNGRLSFYSIGESLDLALLDTRVTTMINAFAAAIP